MDLSPNGKDLLTAGDTCWRIERADRLAHIVDAADYFRVAKAAMLSAKRRIMLIGWDFDTRIELEPHAQMLAGPNKLGDFLSWLVKRNPELDVYLLKWDVGMWAGISRGMPPILMLNWVTNRRLHFQPDSAHPIGSAHHEKIVVIDDVFAFCGGIDMTVERWDTRSHTDEDERRIDPGGSQHGPWHDATTAVSGPAARALGELARTRWLAASGDELAPVTVSEETIWPELLEPSMTDVDVAIARSRPAYGSNEGSREIEHLYLTIIANARKSLYIETQYLASRVIVEAIVGRLSEPDCPDIVVVLPRNADGWLEQLAMDGARRRLLHVLWRADVHGKFRAYYPVTGEGKPIYVHAKVLVMDDRLLRIGSSNLNNRSMGFDSECDLAVDAAVQNDSKVVAAKIIDIRDDLICEHLACSRDQLVRALTEADGSLIGAIDSLAKPEGRSLRAFGKEDVNGEDSVFAENELMDPEGQAENGPAWVQKIRKQALKRMRGHSVESEKAEKATQ